MKDARRFATLPARKIIGFVMMSVGIAGIAGVVLLFLCGIFLALCAAFIEEPFVAVPLAAAAALVAGAYYCRKRKPLVRLTLLISAGTLLAWVGIWSWWPAPLEKYGVTYEISYAEHAEYQSVQFYWKRGQTLVDGPLVQGEELSVTYPHANDDPVPEILVESRTQPSGFALFKLNFHDPTHPAFELVAYRRIEVDYPVPWFYFYDNKEEAPASFALPRADWWRELNL